MSAGFGTVRARLASALADPFFAEALFDTTPDIVFFVKDGEGRYLCVNETLVRRLGRRRKEDVLGRRAEDLFPPPLGLSYGAQDRLVLAGRGEIRDRLELHLHDDGTRGFCLTCKLPLRGRDGRPVGVAGLSRDIAPLKARGPRGGDAAAYRALTRAVARIQDDYGRPLRLSAVARSVGLSESAFLRLSRRHLHLTPGQILVKARVEAASRLLTETEERVAAIAQRCGYADHSAFTRQFRSTTGLTPRQYRAATRSRGSEGRRPLAPQ